MIWYLLTRRESPHRNEAQCQDMKKLIDGWMRLTREVYLVLSATTKYKDLLEIADT